LADAVNPLPILLLSWLTLRLCTSHIIKWEIPSGYTQTVRTSPYCTRIICREILLLILCGICYCCRICII